MSAFKMKRFQLFVLLVMVSALCVWPPWAGLEAKALRFGEEAKEIPVTLMEVESTVAVIRPVDNDLEKGWKAVKAALEDRFGVVLVESNTENLTLTVGIGSNISKEYLTNAIGAVGEILEVRREMPAVMRDKISAALFGRLDPYRMGGVSLKWGSENSLLLVGVDGVGHRARITKEGRLEIYVQDTPAISLKDIASIGMASAVGPFGRIAVEFSEDGLSRFNSHLRGREGEMIVFYLDLPFDAVLVYNGSKMSFKSFSYDEVSFRLNDNERNFPLAPPVLRCIEGEGLPAGAENFLKSVAVEKRRLILLGSPRDNWPSFESVPSYLIEYVEMREGEEPDNLVRRASGLVSSIMIGLDIAENGLAEGGLYLPAGGDLQTARELRSILVNRLPARAHILEVSSAEPALGEDFPSKVFFSTLAGIFVISCIFVGFHRLVKIGIAVFAILACELIVLLGAISLFGMVVGLKVILALLLFTGIETSFLLSMTAGMIGEALKEKGASIGWRAQKVIGQANRFSALAILSLLIIGWLGPPVLWSTLLILAVGLLLSMVLVKPFYCRLLANIYSGMVRAEGQ